MKNLLLEYMPLEFDSAQLFREAADPSKPLRIKGILQRADAKNQNGRIYPLEILRREVEKYMSEFVQQRRALGELDHPESSVVNLKNVSHNIIEMHWEGDDLLGTIEILSTPCGQIVRELLKNNIRLGVSSRGMGSVKKIDEATVQVDSDFSLISFDLVSNPSTQGAFLSESVYPGLRLKEERLNSLIVDFLSEVSRK